MGVVDDDQCAARCNGVREKVVRLPVNTVIRGDGWLVGVGAHHIESQFSLGQELGPPIDGKGGVGAGK
jgi:hypothetical protein